ncbi:hypothetical protein NKR23_g4378 [Pleurostoma richardsiae]|uniref:Uncharacterized protein n=1 Tax=Pleurostoma richardsiae TaxID=41990 RepID=A0AA38VSI0_9PEZI|nr:hypothetical protein NKR23_g4378 [Pleurostoma richardsiae]
MRTSLQQSIQAYRSSLQTTEICPTSDLEASSQAQQTAVRAPDEDNYFNMDFTTAPVNDFTPWFLSPFLFNSLESLNNTTQRL